MRKNLKSIVIGITAFYCISWAQNDTTKIEMLNQQPMVRTVVEKRIIVPKDPILSGLLSAQLPGIGQMYCGKWLKGGFFLISTTVLYGVANDHNQKTDKPLLSHEERQKYSNSAAALFMAGLIIHVWNIFDAYKTAEVYNRRILEQGIGFSNWNIGIAYRNKKASIYLTKNL